MYAPMHTRASFAHTRARNELITRGNIQRDAESFFQQEE